MTDRIKRDYSVTVRLSEDEKQQLEGLAERFDDDKSATMRRALQTLVTDQQRLLPQAGQFQPLNGSDVVFAIRLRGERRGT